MKIYLELNYHYANVAYFYSESEEIIVCPDLVGHKIKTRNLVTKNNYFNLYKQDIKGLKANYLILYKRKMLIN